MKIGIITDIHSNITALEAVFDVFEKENVEKVICLGDIIGIGAHPEECVSFLLNKQDMIISWILGNHERYLITGIPKTHHSIPNGNPTRKIEFDCYAWNHSKLSNEERKFLMERPKSVKLEIDGVKIVLEHYPYKDDDNFSNTYLEHPSFPEIRDLFRDKDADIYFYGHTHIRNVVKENGISYINPGSVGCPLENGMASSGILEIENGKYNYTNLDVKYDVEAVVEDIVNINYPMCRFMCKRFYNIYKGEDQE